MLQNGDVVHFALHKEGEFNTLFSAEIFDSEGSLRFWQYIPQFESYGPGQFKIGWKDNDDKFYMIDHAADFPVIRVFSLAY